MPTPNTQAMASGNLADRTDGARDIDLDEIEMITTSGRPGHTSSSSSVKYPTVRRRKQRQKMGFGSLRFRKMDADSIVDTLTNNPDEEPMELEAEDLRALPTTIAVKRNIRKRVQEQLKGNKKEWYQGVQDVNSKGWKKLKQSLAETLYSLELWRGELKNVQGKFGSGVTSYFLLLKFLLLLNIPVVVLSFSFMVLPMILHRWQQQVPPGYTRNVTFSGWELLTGSGWFLGTELYYGTYIDGDITFLPPLTYSMQHAYLFVCAAYYILTLVILLRNLTLSYKRNYIESSGALGFYYVTKVLNGWDFGITIPKTAKRKREGLTKEYQEFVSGLDKSRTKQDCGSFFKLTFLRLFTNLVVLVLLAGSGYLVWYLARNVKLIQVENDAELNDLSMPTCLTAINFILPFVFSVIASVEQYESPRTKLYLTMLRTITLNAVTLGCMIHFWFTSCSQVQASSFCESCWENYMGEQIYSLVMIDFIFLLVFTFISEFLRRVLADYLCKSLRRPGFNIARNSLHLIYSQMLVWLGFYYCPLLSVVMIIKIIVIFYVKKASLMHNCSMSKKPWRAGRTSTIILTLLAFAFLLSFIVVCYSVGFITPSRDCGPYKGQNLTIDVVSEIFSGWATEVSWITELLAFFTSTAFLIGVAATLMAVVHYSRVVAHGNDQMVRRLREQIKLEGKDKMFLLNLQQEIVSRNRAEARAARDARLLAENNWAEINRAPTLKPPKRHKDESDKDRVQPGITSDLSNNISSPNNSAALQTENYNFGYADKSCDRNDLQQLNANKHHSADYASPYRPLQGQHYNIYQSPDATTSAKQEYI